MPRNTKSAVQPAASAAEELFVKIGAEGEELPITAKEWEAVKHRATGLLFPAELHGQEAGWKVAIKHPAKLKLAGRTDWRTASRVEALHIIDDTKFGPAVDTRFFRYPKYGWIWTSTQSAECPESLAWYLSLYGGVAIRSYQSYQGLALAVCGPVPPASQ